MDGTADDGEGAGRWGPDGYGARRPWGWRW